MSEDYMSVHITSGPTAEIVVGNPPRIVDMLKGEYSLTSPSALFNKKGKLFISTYIAQCTEWFGVSCIIHHGQDDLWYVVLNKQFAKYQIRERDNKPGQEVDHLELLSPLGFFWRCLMVKWFDKSPIKNLDETGR
jgi:hypothetical protein